MPTILDWLIRQYPTAKRQTFKQMLVSGRISINGRRPRSLKDVVADADRVVVSEKVADRKPTFAGSLPFTIVFEDRDVLVIDKPPGLITSTTPREKRPTAWAAIQAYLAATDPAARPGLIHRLDRDASGLLIFSKNPIAFRSLKQQFLHHTVSRIYTAHVNGKLTPPAGRLESRLIERLDGIVQSTRHRSRGQVAITEYETISTSNGQSVLRVTLETGRKHQIRAQLAEQGAPVVNDPLYGDGPVSGRLMLSAVELSFDHPRSGKRATFRLDENAV